MKNIFLVIIAFTFLACDNDDNDNTSEPAVQTGPIVFVDIDKSHLGGMGIPSLAPSNLVIDNDLDWVNLMNDMDALSSNPNGVTIDFSQTNIDFNQFIVIAVFREVFPHIEFVEITEVMENANDIEVTTVDSNFNGGFLATSQPYHIIIIPKTTKPIVFL